jgi:hypothetical protein
MLVGYGLCSIQCFSAKKLQTQIVSTLKVRKELWYEKAACNVLLKLTVIPKFSAQLLSAYNLGL